jgi:hypothetical protein
VHVCIAVAVGGRGSGVGLTWKVGIVSNVGLSMGGERIDAALRNFVCLR